MSDDGYFIEDGEKPRFRRYPAAKPRPQQLGGPPRRYEPVWRTREQLWMVLDQYRQWREQGLSDGQMSYAIQRRLL